MTKKGFESLNSIIQENLKSVISEVIIGRDKNIDNDFANEIKTVCKLNNIVFWERTDTFEISSDYSIAISWRWLIPQSKSKLIVLHDSLLPRYRGFSPLVNMLCNKETELGVTAIFASEEYDTGDIIAQSSLKVTYPIKIADAIDLISQKYVVVVLKILSAIVGGSQLIAKKQDENFATYSLWRDEEDYIVNWAKDSEEILNLINALSKPYKGASAFINGTKKVRILEAELFDDVKIENRNVGKVLFVKGKYPVIVCGVGLIKLLKVVDDETQEDLLPLKNFRIRLTTSNKV